MVKMAVFGASRIDKIDFTCSYGKEFLLYQIALLFISEKLFSRNFC